MNYSKLVYNKTGFIENNSREIDQLLATTKHLWKNLECHCTADCCGINAFSFEKNEIWNATLDLNIPELINKLKILSSNLDEIEDSVIHSNILNQYMYRNGFHELIKHILNTLSYLHKSENKKYT